MRNASRSKTPEHDLTTRDAVVLSLLAEGPAHGYALEAELQRRDVRDWADISRAQVYKSLAKLQSLGLAEAAPSRDAPRGPEPARLRISRAGTRALRLRLQDEAWSTTRERPAFLTWLALCAMLPKEAIAGGIEARRRYLASELARERRTARAIADDPTVTTPFPQAMVDLTIRQFETELAWLDELKRKATS